MDIHKFLLNNNISTSALIDTSFISAMTLKIFERFNFNK